jgi:hypothetical protein
MPDVFGMTTSLIETGLSAQGPRHCEDIPSFELVDHLRGGLNAASQCRWWPE